MRWNHTHLLYTYRPERFDIPAMNMINWKKLPGVCPLMKRIIALLFMLVFSFSCIAGYAQEGDIIRLWDETKIRELEPMTVFATRLAFVKALEQQ